MGTFIGEEKGQGAIEYLLLAGGVILAAVLIFIIYSKITTMGGSSFNETGDAATSVMSSKIETSIGGMF
jgi:uncharacterized protein (UPF0333 family)